MPSPADDAPPRLIAGLGNPGRQYADTRHNVGFMVADEVARQLGLSFSHEKKWEAEVAREGADFIVVKPLTFMNDSGKAVARVAKFFKIDPAEVMVVYDEMDLPLGKLRLRLQGSPAGHNGMKSIVSSLGTQGIPRLRLGIGGAGGQERATGHVLGKFSSSEQPDVAKMVATAADCVVHAARHGVEAAMNTFNPSPSPSPKPKKKKPENSSPASESPPDNENESPGDSSSGPESKT